MTMFAYFYINIIIFLKGGIILSTLKRFKDALSPLLGFVACLLYLKGMSRNGGPDIENYRAIYEGIGKITLLDPGFNFLNFVGRSLGLPFEVYLFLIGVINLYLIKKISVYFNVNFGVVVTVMIFHLMVVRDFAQLRVGLAINMVLFSYTLKSNLRYILYLFSGSIHFTALALIGLLESFKFFQYNSKIYKLLPFFGIILLGMNFYLLTFIDPRIEIYLNWDVENYGQSVNNYNQLFFISYLIAISTFNYKKNNNLFIFSFLFSFVVFVSFSTAAIFSYRLANVCLSLYPYFIAHILMDKKNGVYKLLVISTLLLIFSLRTHTNQIILSLKF